MCRITPEDYVELVKNFSPEVYTTPTHSIIPESSKKKKERAVKTSREYIDWFGKEDLGADMLLTVSVEESYKVRL